FADSYRDATPGCGLPAADAVQGKGFSRYTAESVELAGIHGGIGVGNPAHLAFARAVIGRGHINRRPDKVLLDQFNGIPAGYIFELPNGIVLGIDGDTPLGTPERYVYDGTFIGHQRRECHHLVFIDHFTIPDTAFGGRHVLRVFYPPCVDYLEVVAPPEREAEPVNAVAYLDLVQQPLRVLGELRCMVKERGYIIEKMGLLRFFC